MLREDPHSLKGTNKDTRSLSVVAVKEPLELIWQFFAAWENQGGWEREKVDLPGSGLFKCWLTGNKPPRRYRECHVTWCHRLLSSAPRLFLRVECWSLVFCPFMKSTKLHIRVHKYTTGIFTLEGKQDPQSKIVNHSKHVYLSFESTFLSVQVQSENKIVCNISQCINVFQKKKTELQIKNKLIIRDNQNQWKHWWNNHFVLNSLDLYI